MLLRKHRCRDQDCRLLAVQDTFHDRPQRNLRLAEANVAAEEPLHRSRRLHIVLDLRNRPQLIVRLRVLKALFKLLLPRRIRRKRKAGPSFPLGVELDEPRGQVLCRRLCLGLGFLPLVAAELIEPNRLVLSA